MRNPVDVFEKLLASICDFLRDASFKLVWVILERLVIDDSLQSAPASLGNMRDVLELLAKEYVGCKC